MNYKTRIKRDRQILLNNFGRAVIDIIQPELEAFVHIKPLISGFRIHPFRCVLELKKYKHFKMNLDIYETNDVYSFHLHYSELYKAHGTQTLNFNFLFEDMADPDLFNDIVRKVMLICSQIDIREHDYDPTCFK